MSRSTPPRRPLRKRNTRRRARLWFGAFGIAGGLLAGGMLLPRWLFPPARPAHGMAVAQAAAGQAQPAVATPPAATPETMQRLQEELDAMAAEAPARDVGIYVQDVETGLSAGVNPNRLFIAASLIKLPVMAAAFEHWEQRPERKTKNALTWMEWMMTVSDNASTDRLIDMVGGPEIVTAGCAERGWDNLKVRHAIINHRGRRGSNECTAREVAEFLVALDKRELVSPEADQEMWEIMTRSRKLARIPAGIPKLPGVEVGNKTGTLGYVLHDAAIVRTPRVRYAICILINRQRSEYHGNRFCRDVSRKVFELLHGAEESASLEDAAAL